MPAIHENSFACTKICVPYGSDIRFENFWGLGGFLGHFQMAFPVHKLPVERALWNVGFFKKNDMKPMICMLCHVLYSIRLVFGFKTLSSGPISVLTNVGLPGDQLLEVFKNEKFQSPLRATFIRATCIILRKFNFTYEPSKLA